MLSKRLFILYIYLLPSSSAYVIILSKNIIHEAIMKIKRRGEIKLKTPLQRHMENKSKEGAETNINRKEPHDAAQKKLIIFKYFNALKYNKDQSLEENLQDIRYCTRVNLGMFVIAVILTILNITRI
uniref:Uncharacterized protein n=1 Tax=Caudovirales sp. ctikv1 TaxID=2826781 RepID=A0A8S5N2S6_9CAUD|nr:MAG TPA: hypothetical protein [Caudovirales sp. ctikv1]